MPVTLTDPNLVYVDEPPVEEPPPEQVPVETAPPPPDAYETAPTYEQFSPEQEAAVAERAAAAPVSAPVPSPGLGGVPVPAEVAAAADVPGPLEQAANTLGGYVAPLVAQAPEAVQNAANIVGQPVGGLISDIQNVADQPDVAGMIGAGFGIFAGPAERGKEQAGERIMQGLPAAPGAENLPQQGLLSPLINAAAQTGVGQALGGVLGPVGSALTAPLPGTGNLPLPPTGAGAIAAGPDPGQALAALPSAVLGTGIDDWARANPDLAQQAYTVGGGAGLIDAYVKQKVNAPPGVAPPQWVNPVDNTTGNVLEKGVQVLGNLPRTFGGIMQSGRQGTLLPFAEEQLIQAAMDPTMVIPEGVGGRLAQSAGRLARRAPIIRTLAEPTAREVARLSGERAVSALSEATDAARRQAEFEARYGTEVAPREPVAGEAAAAAPTGETIVQQMNAGGEDVYRLVSPTRGLDYPTLEAAVAANPNARVLPTRAEMVQQFETGLNDLVQTDGSINPLDEQHFRDAIAMQNPAAFGPQEAAAIKRRQSVRGTYNAAAPEFQQSVEARLPTDDHLYHGVTMSREAAAMMEERANGRLRFPDGFQPRDMTLGELHEKMLSDGDSWLNGFDEQGNITARAERSSGWRTLNDRLNPNKTADVIRMKRDPKALSDHLNGMMQDAADRGGMPPGRRTALGNVWSGYTNVYRTAQLFNIFNVPRYMLQNMSNAFNILAKGGGVKPTWDFLTNIKEGMRAYGSLRDTTSSVIDDLSARTGQSRPNISMTQRPYMDRISGPLPKWADYPLRAIAPNWGRDLASTVDLRARESVGAHAIFKGYKDLNARMPEIIERQARKTSPSLAPAPGKAEQVFTDFADQHRTLDSARGGTPRTGLLGQVETHEPTWHPEDLRPYLREHLFEDMPIKPNPGQMNRIVNELLGTTRDEVRRIWDTAEKTADSALFSWRHTKGDELLGKVTLFHYWMSRQGGFYIQEMMKHPYIAAAYGRMMDDMQQQNEDLGGPAWLTGWFQLMNSPAGFSIWMDPTDVVQSLLTFPDAMTGENDPSRFDDLTAVGQKAKEIPLFIHPALMLVAQQTGLLGPDARIPDPTGVGTFGVNAINIMNLANFQDAPFMQMLNKAGVGVDKDGNKIPLAPRPIQDLLAHTGNALSSALAPLTGLSPTEAMPSWASGEADVRKVGEQEIRSQHPEWNDGSAEGEMRIMGLVTDILADPSNPELERWRGMVAQEPYQASADIPQPLAGLMRLVSPIATKSMPEQAALDKMPGLLPSGNTETRGLPDPNDPEAGDIFDQAKYGGSQTVEGRLLNQRVNEYTTLGDPEVKDAYTVKNQIIYGNMPDGGITTSDGTYYSNDQLKNMSYDEHQAVIDDYYAQKGVTESQVTGLKEERQKYLADNPDVAGFVQFKQLAGFTDEENKAFVDEMRLTNPGFQQYYESQMINHVTGEVKYWTVKTPDAYLAASGVRPSVYSSTVGGEPSTAKGGYPSIPGVEEGQPILPTAELSTNAVGDTFIYQTAKDVTWNGKEGHEPVSIVSPNLPIQTLGQPETVTHTYKGVTTTYQMQQVALLGQPDKPIGWIDQSMLVNASPTRPVGRGTVEQPGGGLVEQAGNVMTALGGVKDAAGGALGAVGGGIGEAIGGAVPGPPAATAEPVLPPAGNPAPIAAPVAPPGGGNPLDAIGAGLGAVVDTVGNVVSSLTGHNSGTPTKPTTTSSPGVAPGKQYTIAAPDGMGISVDPGPSDQTWMEDMIGKGHAAVTVQYKGLAPAGVDYSYQNGHGAQMIDCGDGSGNMCFVHAGNDISCDTGGMSCWGTQIYAPMDGVVGCAGYGAGNSGAPDIGTCNYSAGTTTANPDGSPPAHTVTLLVGTDPDGNELRLSFNHLGKADLVNGQQITKGDALALMGSGACDSGPCPHLHLEAWGYSPALGGTKLLDPALVQSGYYFTHSVDDSGTTPAPTTTPSTTEPATGPEAQYQIDAGAPVAPPPSQSLGDILGGAASGLIGGALNAFSAPAGATSPEMPTYTAEDGTTYEFVDPTGKPTTPNYGYFDGTAYPDNADGTRALEPRYIVYHYTATDDMDGFINDFMGKTEKTTSSNYVLDKDGTLYTIVPPDYTAWANGRVDMPPADATPGANFNQETISIEIVNNGSEPYTPEQIATLQSWTGDISAQYEIAPDHLIGHSDVTSDKSDPGTYFPWDLVRASAQ